jgi:hypothetical protein
MHTCSTARTNRLMRSGWVAGAGRMSVRQLSVWPAPPLRPRFSGGGGASAAQNEPANLQLVVIEEPQEILTLHRALIEMKFDDLSTSTLAARSSPQSSTAWPITSLSAGLTSFVEFIRLDSDILAAATVASRSRSNDAPSSRTEPVKGFLDTELCCHLFCSRVCSSGGLIQAAVGSLGGSGRRPNRSGLRA